MPATTGGSSAPSTTADTATTTTVSETLPITSSASSVPEVTGRSCIKVSSDSPDARLLFLESRPVVQLVHRANPSARFHARCLRASAELRLRTRLHTFLISFRARSRCSRGLAPWAWAVEMEATALLTRQLAIFTGCFARPYAGWAIAVANAVPASTELSPAFSLCQTVPRQQDPTGSGNSDRKQHLHC